jgi:cyclopropane fatty-acyl-phospholipid synthase-like methyltransferase
MTPPLRRSVFDPVADLYDRARPSYPDALISDLVALAALPVGGRVLEIGCGTGQMTLPLAQCGYSIDAIELGPALAAVAARKLAQHAAVRVHNGAFEDWTLPPEPYDVVVSATAFHWIDQRVRFEKTAAALKPSGALAVVETHHVSGRDDAFFDDVQPCYEAHMPGTPSGIRLSPAGSIPLTLDESSAERFSVPDVRRYNVEIPYTTKQYIDVLSTYSGHIELEAEHRQALYACIGDLLERRFGGTIRKQYLFALIVARRR